MVQRNKHFGEEWKWTGQREGRHSGGITPNYKMAVPVRGIFASNGKHVALTFSNGIDRNERIIFRNVVSSARTAGPTGSIRRIEWPWWALQRWRHLSDWRPIYRKLTPVNWNRWLPDAFRFGLAEGLGWIELVWLPPLPDQFVSCSSGWNASGRHCAGIGTCGRRARRNRRKHADVVDFHGIPAVNDWSVSDHWLPEPADWTEPSAAE